MLFLDRFHDLVGIGLDHARIVRALQDNERLGDLIGVEERRNFAQHFHLRIWIADLRVERFPLRLPVRRDALERSDPIRHAEYVHACREFFGLKGQRRQDHVTAVGATHDPDFLSVHVIE